MATFAVYQSLTPTFGLPETTGLVDAAVYDVVARGTVDGMTDEQICERAFRATNSIDDAWYEVAEQFGLSDVKEARSTSVGDLVRIEDESGARFYQCAAVGWVRHHGPVSTG
jgi:hypothetical protein